MEILFGATARARLGLSTNSWRVCVGADPPRRGRPGSVYTLGGVGVHMELLDGERDGHAILARSCKSTMLPLMKPDDLVEFLTELEAVRGIAR